MKALRVVHRETIYRGRIIGVLFAQRAGKA